MKRCIGIDIGAETLKVAEVLFENDRLELGRTTLVEHHEDPGSAVLKALEAFDWPSVDYAAVTGRLGRLLELGRVPIKAAQIAGLDTLLPELMPVTLVSIGSRGFSVLERRDGDATVYRENSRCSQGTGNFLRQLVSRFGLTVEDAGELCADVDDPAPLSGRCPVILKTDMTHLANKGENKTRILAGLYDAVCENVCVLIKPNLAPPRVVLAGGVSQARRIRNRFRQALERDGMQLVEPEGVNLLMLEAVGAATEAARAEMHAPLIDDLVSPTTEVSFDEVPALHQALSRVHRLERKTPTNGNGSGNGPYQIVLGFDIGSTGSKLVALDAGASDIVWESYVSTSGNPVSAAQTLMQRFIDMSDDRHRVVAVAATGSGREIVGSLLSTCYGSEQVFVLNEIAAHAAGATHYDPEVDTIFEIGGQDAKYIRLSDGQVYDAAMNEACSAGTGSFIEEQGKKFAQVRDVVQMGRLAVEADSGISLGQHCSVFMAEVIDSAVSAGIGQAAILAGIYDSIIQNYLNRVKGNRSIGNKIFCQGMPFASDALAAAVAHRTGRDVVVPPNPGTVGALGISLLAIKELDLGAAIEPIEPRRFLDAEVVSKDKLDCPSTKGCGEPGNRCGIDRLTTLVAGKRQKFLWGGHCSLYDRGSGKRKLPDMAPAPFRERRALLQDVFDATSAGESGHATVAISDEFLLKQLFPFFGTFIRELGFDLMIRTDAGQSVLKRGIGESNVPYCAPVQLYNGVVRELVDQKPDYLLVPMLRDLPRIDNLPLSTACPVSQAIPDLVRLNIETKGGPKLLAPRIDMGVENFESQLFVDSCERLAESLGITSLAWQDAYEKGKTAQYVFDRACKAIGHRALAFCAEHDITPVVVLGRPYTMHNRLLNANIPNILREQGAIGIPLDCYPIDDDTPSFKSLYWAHSQPILRAAHQVRRSPDVYAIYCSTYSCGPDSFDLHFFSYMMDGKPCAVIETDGHSADAGTRTRIEAFLYCVQSDRNSENGSIRKRMMDFAEIEAPSPSLPEVKGDNRIILLPHLGPSVDVAAAGLRAEGFRAESLPASNTKALQIGRKYTSGKECVPATITLGTFLQRVEAGDDDQRYAFFMPAASGPCRQGVYNLFDKIVFANLGLSDRVCLVTQPEHDFFQGLGQGAALRLWAGIVAADHLLDMLHDTRPTERIEGGAKEIYDRVFAEIIDMLESKPAPSLLRGLSEIPRDMYGFRSLLLRAGAEFAALKNGDNSMPTVLLVGETYVRIDPYLNDNVIDRLERRGIKTKLVPFTELMEYADWESVRKLDEGRHGHAAQWLSGFITKEIKLAVIERLYSACKKALDWGPRCRLVDSIEAAEPYLRSDLYGEAVPTVGGPVHEYKEGVIVGAINVGPMECMPTKVSEAQFFHVAERLGLITLTVTTNGDSLSAEVLDNFAFEVHSKFANGNGDGKEPHRTAEARPSA